MTMYDTRALAIAATIPVGVQAIKITRYAMGYPLSYATYIPGNGPMEFQEAGGHYWHLDLSGSIIDVHWFGAKPSPLGTAAGSLTDNTAAIQAAIDATAAGGGGTLQFGRGAYASGSVTISTSNIYLKGVGYNATTIVHTMSGTSTLFNFVASPSILSNCGISDLAIGSADTTNDKTAILMQDVSEIYVKNVNIAHYPIDGSMYRGSGAAGVGLRLLGRELGHVENVEVYANNPIVIGGVPGLANSGLDSWVFRDIICYTAVATNYVISVLDGTIMSNVTFCGHQNWIGGYDGFHWIDSVSTAISFGLYFSGVKSEQAPGSGGYAFNIQPNQTLFGLRISDCVLGDRNGIAITKTMNATVSNVFYDSNSNPTKVGLNIDATSHMVQLLNCVWAGGTLLTNAGLTLENATFVAGLSTALPSSGVYRLV
ncbi:MAG TPA: glycosyl hydrolase family 28-related protein [Bradyrhizobium sp.]|nr:glycosyl hydrolase family 28-related protein [Bradyrhizobium sp.]